MTALALLWARFMASPVGKWAAIIGGAVLAVLTFGWSQKRKGAAEATARAEQKAQDARNEREREIGDRAADVARAQLDARRGDIVDRLRSGKFGQ